METTSRRGRKISEVAARAIARDAVERRLAPGTMLPSEAEMMRELGVGRATLREALRILEVNGVITLKPGRGGGPVVAGSSTEHFAELSRLHLQVVQATYGEVLETRLVLEAQLAKATAERRDDAGLARLTAALEAIEAVDPDDVEAFQSVHAGFQEVMADLCENRVLALLVRALRVVAWSHIGVGRVQPPDREEIRAAHRRLYDAVAERDGKRAADETWTVTERFADAVRTQAPDLYGEPVSWDLR